MIVSYSSFAASRPDCKSTLFSDFCGMFAESFEIVSAMMPPSQAAGSSQFHHHHHGGGSWLTIWSSNPRVTVGLGLMALVYGAGVYRLWARAGKGAGVSTGRAASFGAGWLTLVIALL